MPNAAVKGTSYSLNHTPELALHYGNTPFVERESHPDSEFLSLLPDHVQNYDECSRYAPNLAYVGAMELEELEKKEQPWYEKLEPASVR